jgi:hypothetical protein
MSDISDRRSITLDHFAESVASSVSRAIELQRGSIRDKIFRYGGRFEIFIETQNVPQLEQQVLGGADQVRGKEKG